MVTPGMVDSSWASCDDALRVRTRTAYLESAARAGGGWSRDCSKKGKAMLTFDDRGALSACSADGED